jgi:isoleucyl-tRNA synthetase
MVLSTALFDQPAFKHLVCNGLVLAADGKKMSKRLKNYPDPTEVINKYGADALRLYLINSPVVRAETLRFKEEGVFGVVKDVFLPWYNAYRFLVQNVRRWELETGETFNPGSTLDAGEALVAAAAAAEANGSSSEQQAAGVAVLDRWIAAAVRSLTAYVRAEMEAYRLYTVVPRLVSFIDQLTNIYVRYNRKRLKGGKGRADCLAALTTLFHVLLTVTKVMSPFTPFICETMYRNLRAALVAAQQQQQQGGAAAAAEVPESVHWCDMPAVEQEREGDARIQASVGRMQAVIEAGRAIREKNNRPLKQPLRRVVVVHPDPDFLADITGELSEYVTSELNVLALDTCSDPLAYAELSAVPDWQGLGKRLGKDMGKVAAAVKGLSMADILAYEKSGSIELAGHTLGEGDIKVVRSFKPPEGVAPGEVDAAGDGEVLVVLDLAQQDDLVEQGLARELVNRYQKLRKKAGLTVTDVVELYYAPAAAADAGIPALLTKIIEGQAGYLTEAFGKPLQALAAKPDSSVVIAQELQNIGGEENGASFIAVLAAAPGSSAAAAAAAAGSVQQMNLQ